MTVHDTRTVVLPRQAGPVDPPLAPLPRRHTGQTADHRAARTAAERQFGLSLLAMWVGLESVIVGGLLLAEQLPH